MHKALTVYLSVFLLVALLAYALVNHWSRIDPPDQSLQAPFQMQPVPFNTGLKKQDWSFWGASGMQGDDGLYHLFVSRIGKCCGLKAWDFNSEVVRAVAEMVTWLDYAPRSCGAQLTHFAGPRDGLVSGSALVK